MISHTIYCKLLVFQRKSAKALGITSVYRSKKGVKAVNPIMQNSKHQILRKVKLRPEKLLLGVDFLKDQYTLCGVNIKASPHYDFMKALNDGADIRNSDYYKRYSNGTLDSRIPACIDAKMQQIFKEKFRTRKKELEEGDLEPVTVYELDGKYYIADGKHRAALCALYEKDVPCAVISCDYLIDSYRLWMLKKMERRAEEYKTNLGVYKIIKEQ